MHELLMDIPKALETDRLILRCYEHGDGEMYFPMAGKIAFSRLDGLLKKII